MCKYPAPTNGLINKLANIHNHQWLCWSRVYPTHSGPYSSSRFCTYRIMFVSKQFSICVFLLMLSGFVQLYAQDATNYRLPKDILPSNYKIKLEPYLEESDGEQRFTFDGEARITFTTQMSELSQIVLHSKSLNYSSITLNERADEAAAIEVMSDNLDDETDMLTLELAQALKANTNYTLNFSYVGQLSVEMRGFYRSSYVDGGVTKWVATTQMEATYARRVFPCFDEPAFKATFDFTIIRPAAFSRTVANTAIISSQP